MTRKQIKYYYTRWPPMGITGPPLGGVGDIGVVTLILLPLADGPKVVKADTDLLGELAQIGPSPLVSMAMGVVIGV